jgi:hypothetical protein
MNAKRKLSLPVFMSLVMIVVLAITMAVSASDVAVAVVDVTAPTDSVTISQGQSGQIKINLTVSGNQSAGDAAFKVNTIWTLKDGVFTGSSPKTFNVPEGTYTSNNPWTDTTTGTVIVDKGQTPGTVPLVVSAFGITNEFPNGSGGKLEDGKDSNYQVTVVVSSKTTTTTTITCPLSVPYNGSEQKPCTATVSGVENGSAAITYSNNTNLGIATAIAKYSGDATHEGSEDTANFTINKAPVTATAGGGSKTYDGQAGVPLDCAVTGAYTTGVTCTNKVASVGPNAGTYTIEPVVNVAEPSNFDVTPVNGFYTIDKASVTATAGGGSGTYNGATQLPSPCVLSGDYLGHLSCANVPDSVGPNADTYSIEPSVTGSDLSNFDVAPVNGSYTIDKAPVTATAGNGSGTYNGAVQAPATCAVTGAYTGDLACTNSPVGPAAGTYDVTPVVNGTDLSNFDVTSVKGSYTINKAPVTATAGSGSSYFDGLTHSPSDCEVTGDYTGDLACTNSPTSVGPNTGTTIITPIVSGTGLTNFEVTSLNGSYSILKWTLSGFYQPVDMDDIWNTVKGGSTVPFKFNVYAATEQTDVKVINGFAVKGVACPSATTQTSDIDFVTTGGTSLRYDTTGHQFIQNWQTPKYPGKCYQVTMTTNDGSTLSALFKLK